MAIAWAPGFESSTVTTMPPVMILSANAISALSAPFLSDEQADKRTITAAIAAMGKFRLINHSAPLDVELAEQYSHLLSFTLDTTLPIE